MNFAPRFFPSLSGDLSSIKKRLVWYHVTGTLNAFTMNYRYKAAKHANAILTQSSGRVAEVGQEGVQVHSTVHFNWEFGKRVAGTNLQVLQYLQNKLSVKSVK